MKRPDAPKGGAGAMRRRAAKPLAPRPLRLRVLTRSLGLDVQSPEPPATNPQQPSGDAP